jgi:hypothetical protein
LKGESKNGWSKEDLQHIHSFLIIEGEKPSTTVTDELGVRWHIERAVDPETLIAKGFRNTAGYIERVLAMPPLPPEKKQ